MKLLLGQNQSFKLALLNPSDMMLDRAATPSLD